MDLLGEATVEELKTKGPDLIRRIGVSSRDGIEDDTALLALCKRIINYSVKINSNI